MPRAEDFKCARCDIKIEILFKDYDDFISKKDSILCTCGAKMIHVFGAPCMIVAENNDPVSAKPSSYWRNAEKNRLKRLEKQRSEETEKHFYRDKETIKKVENTRQNSDEARA